MTHNERNFSLMLVAAGWSGAFLFLLCVFQGKLCSSFPLSFSMPFPLSQTSTGHKIQKSRELVRLLLCVFQGKLCSSFPLSFSMPFPLPETSTGHKIQKSRELVPLLNSAFAIPASKSLLCLDARRLCSLSSLVAKSQLICICLIQPTTTTMITTNKNKQGQINSQQPLLPLLLLLYHHPNTPICLIEKIKLCTD